MLRTCVAEHHMSYATGGSRLGFGEHCRLSSVVFSGREVRTVRLQITDPKYRLQMDAKGRAADERGEYADCRSGMQIAASALGWTLFKNDLCPAKRLRTGESADCRSQIQIADGRRGGSCRRGRGTCRLQIRNADQLAPSAGLGSKMMYFSQPNG